MRVWYHSICADEKSVKTIDAPVARIGSDPRCDIVLPARFVAPEALLVTRRSLRYDLTAVGVNGCELGGVRLQSGDHATLHDGAEVRLYPYVLKFELDSARGGTIAPSRSRGALDRQMTELVRAMHAKLLATVEAHDTDRARVEGGEAMLRLEGSIDELARHEGLLMGARRALLQHVAGASIRGNLVDRLLERAGRASQFSVAQGSAWSQLASSVPEREQECSGLTHDTAQDLELTSEASLETNLSRIETRFWSCWERRTSSVMPEMIQYLAFRRLKQQVKDILFGLGPLEDLLRLPHVTEVMVVGKDKIYVEKNGIIENSGRQFVSDDAALSVIERIVGEAGRRIDKSQPVVDVRLPDGSRAHAAIPPVAVGGPCLTIRRFPLRRWRMDDLLHYSMLNDATAEFLRAAVLARKNILVSGGTGAGKTTLLNCLADWFPEKERIIVIEDTSELRLNHAHVVRLESRHANNEGAGALRIRELVRQALRMRPDRIVVGECRGEEALDMLQAMNTGHDGSLTTVHANNPSDVVSRLETMVQTAANLALPAIHRQIAAALDLIVHVEKRNGVRCITQIAELVGEGGIDSRLGVKPLFEIPRGGSSLRPTGRLPSFAGELIDAGWFRVEGFLLTA